jgi:hypothetical protein
MYVYEKKEGEKRETHQDAHLSFFLGKSKATQ